MYGFTWAYDFQLQIHSDRSPVSEVYIRTNRSCLSKNYAILGIPDALKTSEGLELVQSYIRDRLDRFGAELQTFRMNADHAQVLAGRVTAGDIVPTAIKIPNHANIRRVVEDLFHHEEITEAERTDMEFSLLELDRATIFARRGEVIGCVDKVREKNVI